MQANDSDPRGNRPAGPRRHPKGAVNEHGTRVLVTIECTRCSKTDTLPFKPKSRKGVLCRACAQEVLGPNWHRGLMGPEGTVERSCPVCSKMFVVRADAPVDELCWDCERGMERPDPTRLQGVAATVDAEGGVKRLRRRRGAQ